MRIFPSNGPFLGYMPGSKERAELKQELAKQSSQVVKIPLIIGGKKVWTKEAIQVTIPHAVKEAFCPCAAVAYLYMSKR